MALALVAGGLWWFWPERTTPAAAEASDRDEQRSSGGATQSESEAGTTEPLPSPGGMAASDADEPDQRDQTRSSSENETTARSEPEQPPLSVIRMGESAATSRSKEEDRGDQREQRRALNDSSDSAENGSSPTTGAVGSLLSQARAAIEQNEPLAARRLLNRALHDQRADARRRAEIRERLAGLNERLVFSPAVFEGDPIAERYVVQSGDTLSNIAAEQNLQIDWRLLLRINEISDPRRLRAGQTIKLLRGPFDAVIDKNEYRLDLYARLADSSAEDERRRLYIRSFHVGLGEYRSTPTGSWLVRQDSKLINPAWTNPRTGEYYSPDNPENPIGERWIGLKGTDEKTAPMTGYGLHGTIDPDSIGEDVSMGCVRLLPDDVAIVYEMLAEGVSRVRIVE